MSSYAYIENDEIKEIHYFLPLSWKNISNFNLLNDEQLKNFNWFPIVDGPQEYNIETHEVVDYELRINQSIVERILILKEKILDVSISTTADTTSTDTIVS